ncbi:hypothetical protein [Sporosarcina sp. Marseille-Q4943]|uniref:hypothetical protein n=1 Tax=Sporosarcina sp. Marseille-Q4943 TaxID=2942204 RepID=UPI00208DB74D|nr:hypothetical protein [Sporosarcina sp. Marseille-Q4943]
MKRRFIVLITICTAFPLFQKDVHAVDRVVVNSIQTDRWYENVYLMADRINWMTFRNFTVQIGDRDGSLFHFPTWESGKYDTYLFREDLNNDKFKDIIIVLDSYQDPIHVLQHDGSSDYKEVTVEPAAVAVKRLVKMEKKGDIVTIATKQKVYNINVKPFHYTTVKPSSTDVSIDGDQVDYSVEENKIVADVPVFITIGGLIGDLKLSYDWTGNGYEVTSVSFKRYIPK